MGLVRQAHVLAKDTDPCQQSSYDGAIAIDNIRREDVLGAAASCRSALCPTARPAGRPGCRQSHRGEQRCGHAPAHPAAHLRELVVAAGIPMFEISRFMAHAKPSTTETVYAHLLHDDHSASMVALGAMAGLPYPRATT